LTLADLKENYYQKKTLYRVCFFSDKNQLWVSEGKKHGAKKETIQNITPIC
tara:strand:+ start:210 stop:362 length:153 start_codon:yes stop_codon:yes gene_type:complete